MAGFQARVGPYQILRLIRRGGQGSVFLGYDSRLRRRVAIKIRALPRSWAARRRLRREARMVAGIQSAKVVQVFDVIESSDHLALVMEYVPGCDLEELLATTRLSLASVLTIGADIASALAAARQQHIVHGDLKAANVLISAAGRVKLTDFGIARDAGADPEGPTAAGSLSGISPEQYQGRPLDIRSDLFALGCLLYRMLAGEHPFYRAGQLQLKLLLEEGPRPLALVAGEREIPDELAGLVSDLLQPDPQNRPENTHAVRRVLRRLTREIPLAASDSLLQQARPHFRHESPDDIPPDIPAGLARSAHSSLDGGGAGLAWLGHRLALMGWPARLATGLSLLILPGLPMVLVARSGATGIYLHQPQMRLDLQAEVPLEVSPGWLGEQARLAVSAALGAVDFSGPLVSRSDQLLVAGGPPADRPADAEEQLHLELRCLKAFCVFAAERERRASRTREQAVLFPDMPVTRWRDIVRDTTGRLYRD